MASKLILLFAVIALATVGVLAGRQDEQLATNSCSRFRHDILNKMIQVCARYISPRRDSSPGDDCGYKIEQYLKEQKYCSTDIITEVVNQCLINNGAGKDEREQTVNCVTLSLTSGVCCNE
ncbi:DNA-directed RNA polymerase III subunit RPC1 [Frankliniella fusca]|uniref:DNA-directed RNA polymerase III subunit RPC1 n=1 Tax=Frankliniella fusca TaxID=407009 RepID=A0AAE1H532_9NEOP|nr:DNA-directed RNA polymerase III subunit RPC1 [Frankliniella fusca]